MQGALVLLLLLGGSSLSTVSAFPHGVVTLACATMTPNHGVDSMVTPPPFSVISNSSTYVSGQEITVTLQANESGVFRGFLLQARVADSGVGPIGTFSVTGSETQLLNCSTVSSAVSHTSRSNKTSIQATWKAPDNEFRDIEFRATFVHSFSEFWVGVRSPRITFTGVIPNTTMAVPSSSTLVPNTTVAVPSSSTTMASNVTVVLNTTVTPNTVENTPSTTPNSSPPLSISSSVLLLLPMMLLTFSNTH